MEKQRFEPTVLGQVRGRTWEICHLFSGKILVGFNPFFEGMLACVFGWYSYNLNDTSTKTAEASLIARNYIYIYIVSKTHVVHPSRCAFWNLSLTILRKHITYNNATLQEKGTQTRKLGKFPRPVDLKTEDSNPHWNRFAWWRDQAIPSGISTVPACSVVCVQSLNL